MNKKQMSEQDIRTKYITPAILAAGWDRDLQIREEVSFTKDYLGHPLQNGAIICDSDSVFGKNKPEQEKEADYFAACFLMPENMVKQKRTEFFNHCPKQTTLFLEDQQLEQQHQLQRYLSDYFQVSMEAMGYRLDELS